VIQSRAVRCAAPLWCLVAFLAGCPAGAPLADSSAADLGPIKPPFVQRLTNDSDPSTTQVKMNLVQWNWARQIAADDSGAVHVVWVQLGSVDINPPADHPDPVDTHALPTGQIYTSRSRDRGTTWSTPRALTTRAAGTDSAGVVTSAGHVYVLWRASDGDRLRAFLRASADRGESFGAAVPVSDNPSGVSVSPPALAASPSPPGAVYTVWADGRVQQVLGQSVTIKEVYLARSADHGATWTAASPVSVPDGFSSWTPAVAAWAGTLHVAWTDERDDTGECTKGSNSCREEEYYRRSLDGGKSWQAELRLTSDAPGAPKESWAPSLAVWGNSVHVAYLDRRTGLFRNYYRRSLDGGQSFLPEVELTADPAFDQAARPHLAVRGQAVHLVWFGFTDFDADIYYSRSLDDGARWSSPLDLTAATAAVGAARMPHVAVAPDGAAHVVWYDSRHSDGAGPRIELYYARLD